ncbi:Prophage Lp1 protein 5 (Modular protein) (fragment) [Rhodococcus sp. RD6.2]|uniref:Ltp family lipoprotein n=1 Tax=Rhodococcus sp. RD6.2 TaxID=260936 RepID=UPI00063BC37F
MDSLDADWNEQAARSAEQYLDFTSFSKSGLIDQLVYEGYTYAQAEYGANSVY